MREVRGELKHIIRPRCFCPHLRRTRLLDLKPWDGGLSCLAHTTGPTIAQVVASIQEQCETNQVRRTGVCYSRGFIREADGWCARQDGGMSRPGTQLCGRNLQVRRIAEAKNWLARGGILENHGQGRPCYQLTAHSPCPSRTRATLYSSLV